jgi:hypothetical protein
LPDRPGSLAGFATTIAHIGGNISFFHYDRSTDSSRVAVEVQLEGEDRLDVLLQSLQENQYGFDSVRGGLDEVLVTAVESILEIKVRLVNRPGSLAFLPGSSSSTTQTSSTCYDEDIDPESADIVMALRTAGGQLLLQAVNEDGYHYRVVYRGSNEQEAAHIIGLKMVEKFFLPQEAPPSSDVAEIKSSWNHPGSCTRTWYTSLPKLETTLRQAMCSRRFLPSRRARSQTGEKFSATAMRPLRFRNWVTLRVRLPSSENFICCATATT